MLFKISKACLAIVLLLILFKWLQNLIICLSIVNFRGTQPKSALQASFEHLEFTPR